MSYFTVDRGSQLQVGQRLDCDEDYHGRRFYPIKPHYSKKDLEAFTHELFPEGLSRHGKYYLLDECLVTFDASGAKNPGCPPAPVIELVVELVRRLSFPAYPSRFTSIFAWETESEAIAFRSKHGANTGMICRISGQVGFRGDMNFIRLGRTILGSWHYAMKYWSGERSPSPEMECLLVGPVVVEEIVAR